MKMKISIMLVVINIIMILPAVSFLASQPRNILYISSYHPGFETFHYQVAGLQSLLDTDDISLDVEFMDSKRFPSVDQKELFYNSLKYKIEHNREYELIIVADDNALTFALEQQKKLFRDIPIVFMGINNIENALTQNENNQVTGVVEDVSMAETIELMIQLFPDTRRIVAIVDNTPSGQGDLKKFYEVGKQYQNHQFSEISLKNYPWPAFLNALSTHGGESSFLLLSAYKDKEGKTYTFEESLQKLKDVTSLPIFHLWHHGIGEGLIGGKVISHFEQGKIAATIAMKVLSGMPVSDMNVKLTSPNKYIFDYTELKQHHIDISALPGKSVLINEPDSFYKKYTILIWVITVTFVLLSIALFVSIFNISKRIKTELNLKNSKAILTALINASPESIFLIDADANVLLANKITADRLGITLEDLIGRCAYELLPPEIATSRKREIDDSFSNNKSNVYYDERDGLHFEHHLYPIQSANEDSKQMAVFSRDVTYQKHSEDELRKNSLTLTTIFNSAPFILVVINEDGRIDDINYKGVEFSDKKKFDISGHLEGEVFNCLNSFKGKGCGFNDNCESCPIRTKVESTFQSGESRMEEEGCMTFLVGGHPTVKNLLISTNLIDIHGERKVLLTIADITSRKEMESSLRESEERYRLLFENSSMGIGISDMSGNVIIANSAMTKMTGYRLSELQQINVGQLYVNSNDRKRLLRLIEKNGIVENYELQMLNKQKKPFWVSISINQIQIKGDQFLLTSQTNIDKRRHTEDALEKRVLALTRSIDDNESIEFEELFNIEDIQQLQDQFATATGVASIITKVDGSPITKGSNFCRLCGEIIRKTDKGMLNCIKSDERIGRYNPDGPNIQPCLSGGLWDAGAAISIGGKHIANWLIGQVRDETQSTEIIREYAHEIGVDEDVMVTAFMEVPAMPREQFELIAQVLFTLANQLSTSAYQNVQQARFITELEQSQDKQRLLQDHLNQAQKMEAIGTLAGGIAHDFNNILSGVIGYTELALNEGKDIPSVSKHLHRVLEAGGRATDLVKQILSFSRRHESEVKPVCPVSITKEVLKLIRSTVASNLTIKEDLTSESYIHADPTNIHQVIMNLCTNATYAMRQKGGVLSVEVQDIHLEKEDLSMHPRVLPGKFVKISVEDSGVGMTKEVQGKVFDPFFTTKELGEGTGMGLSTVHGIVTKLGGFVSLYSELGKGTAIHLFIPLIPASSNEQKENDFIELRGGNEKILFLDDEQFLVDLAKDQLTRYGYHVDAFSDSIKALNYFQRHSKEYDLIITDVTMPNMTGDEFIKKVRMEREDISVILCTGFSYIINEEKANHLGVNAFLNKPIVLADLLNSIREVLD